MCFKNSTFLKPDLIFFGHLLHEAAYHELPGTPAGMALTRNHTTHHFHFLGLLHVAYIQCSPVGLLFLFPSMIWPHVSEEIKNKGPLYWLCHLHIWTLWLWFHEPTKMRRRQPLCSQTSDFACLFQSLCACATLWIAARQALQFMGFSRQEYWSGLPYHSPGDLPNPGPEPKSLSSALQADSLPT